VKGKERAAIISSSKNKGISPGSAQREKKLMNEKGRVRKGGETRAQKKPRVLYSR